MLHFLQDDGESRKAYDFEVCGHTNNQHNVGLAPHGLPEVRAVFEAEEAIFAMQYDGIPGDGLENKIKALYQMCSAYCTCLK